MSGFLVSRRRRADHSSIWRRGPDRERRLTRDGYDFAQFEVDATGAVAPDAFYDDDLVVVFDGEVYNRPESAGVAETVIGLYRQHGEDFASRLDGDFAVAVYDFDRRWLVTATDPFATKPIFVHGTEVASYPSGLGGRGERVPPNTVLVVGLDDGSRRGGPVQPFDFDHQHKNGYDDVIAAFEAAVRKRATDRCYLPLSAGYDSGAIDCALARLSIEYKPYSIEGEENLELLRRRNRSGEILHMDADLFARHQAILERHAEPEGFHVRIVNDEGVARIYDVLEDNASSGLALIHTLAGAEGRKVSLSGTGAEILSEHRGEWPRQLRPWPDFSGRMAAAYLAKEEFAAGVFGVEVRYPFFDRTLVQEFLWLTADCKGRFYKAPLHVYMTRCGYPFDVDVKTGFIPLCD